VSRPFVVGLLGRAGSGKSTLAKYLQQNYDAEVFSFASPLKGLAKDLLELQDSQLYGTQAEKETVDPRYGFSARTFMERLGNGARKHLGEAVWRDGCFFAIEKHFREHGCRMYVIDDVRYPNEALGIKTHFGGVVVKLVCSDAATQANPNSETERCVDQVPDREVDYLISTFRTPGAAGLIRLFETEILDSILQKGYGRNSP
jgi:hypothetical protein